MLDIHVDRKPVRDGCATGLGKVLWSWLPQLYQISLNRRTIASPHGYGRTSFAETSNPAS
jgi:hypothetical protein